MQGFPITMRTLLHLNSKKSKNATRLLMVKQSVANIRQSSRVTGRMDVPVTPQNGATLEGTGAECAAPTIEIGRVAAAESRSDLLWREGLLLHGHLK